MPHRIVIYLHFREFGRLSNTGALLLSAFPDQVWLILHSGPASALPLLRLHPIRAAFKRHFAPARRSCS
jgi:hypothetical protein